MGINDQPRIHLFNTPILHYHPFSRPYIPFPIRLIYSPHTTLFRFSSFVIYSSGLWPFATVGWPLQEKDPQSEFNR